jgi:hypothetical protein
MKKMDKHQSVSMLKFHCIYETLVPIDENDTLDDAIRTPFFLLRAIVLLRLRSKSECCKTAFHSVRQKSRECILHGKDACSKFASLHAQDMPCRHEKVRQWRNVRPTDARNLCWPLFIARRGGPTSSAIYHQPVLRPRRYVQGPNDARKTSNQNEKRNEWVLSFALSIRYFMLDGYLFHYYPSKYYSLFGGYIVKGWAMTDIPSPSLPSHLPDATSEDTVRSVRSPRGY